MRALDRKLVRDLARMKGQAVSIGLVVASGVAIFVASLSTYGSLTENRARYYREARFADLFASLERAPASVEERIAAIPGVQAVETRIVDEVRLEMPRVAEPVVARMVSVPQPSRARLHRLRLRAGRFVETGRPGEVMVDAEFAAAQGLEPGSRFVAILNGRKEPLQVAGVAMSAEFVALVRPGEVLPDPLHYGVLWMDREAMAAAFDMEGAFNDVLLTLGPHAREGEVLDALDRVLERWGGHGAYGRREQPSHRYLSDELEELRVEATFVPAIFLAVAAFLLNVVVARLVATERGQIATLKALGYSNAAVGAHYLLLVTGIAAAGTLAGVAGGALMGRGWAGLYAPFFRFPEVLYRLEAWVPLAAAGLSLGAVALGTAAAVRGAVRLAPAEAMQPPAPPSFRRSALERLGLGRLLSAQGRMILRSLGRRPGRAALAVLGIAAATGVVVVGSFWRDAMAELIDVQFSRVQREDATVAFIRPVPERAARELAHLPGISYVEGVRAVAATVRAGWRSRRTGLLGLPADSRLHPLRSARPEAGTSKPDAPAAGSLILPSEGLVLSARMAEVLGARVGDLVEVEVHEGARPRRELPVAGIADELIGLSAYLERRALDRLMGEGPALSAALVRLEADRAGEVYARLGERPEVASVQLKAGALRTFEETFAGIILLFSAFLTAFAAIIVFGVVYNSARIMLAERAWELASLRVLGFTRHEITTLLLGELAVLVALGIPAGMIFGWGLGLLSLGTMGPETLRIPLIILPRTYANAALVVLAAAVASAALVRRQLDRLDLVAVLKARE